MEDLIYPKSISYKPLEYNYPILESGNISKIHEIGTDQVVEVFITIFPWLTDPICHNLLLAGGSLSSIIQALSMDKIPTIADINDLDFFMVGMKPDSCPSKYGSPIPTMPNFIRQSNTIPIIKELESISCRSKIETIITKLKSIYPNCLLVRTPYAITLTDGIHKFQIILASYETPTQVLKSFDLGASKSGIYFTAGCYRFITTPEGLYSLEHRINIVDPDKHSDIYVSRITKYFQRGYTIGFPRLQTQESFKAGDQIKLPYLTIQLDDIQDKRMIGTIVVDKLTDQLVGYDCNLDYKMINSDKSCYDSGTCIARFIRNNKLLVAKVNASEFQTGEEAIMKSLTMHEITPLEVVYYLPVIYSNGKLDVEICSTLKDFDFTEFLKCYQQVDLLNSYLTAVYYYPKAIEYTASYHEAYAEFCQFNIFPFNRDLFGRTPKSDLDWYGQYC